MKSLGSCALYLLLGSLLYSCGSYKKTTYFQDINRSVVTREKVTNYLPPTIQHDDILGISISSLNPESSAVFNFASNAGNGDTEILSGNLVDQKGEIQLPVIGNIKAYGLTTAQLKEHIRMKLIPYLKEPVVMIKLMNFKVSVMGDVAKPGLFKVPSERLTIPEAISLAGDLNMTALRKVLIIRENDGERLFVTVDLTKKNIFDSPYYYLKTNDVIYVEAGKTKDPALNQTYQKIGLLLTVISVIGIFITR
ncbi:polysaccharide biosynthesis/export family protein [Pedobacter immunditicola]|uniref:polysaccharide biosynthesis/export family protein n=1 Tax=Pedobacter immunditicola TaxID=3133440 RepID=UPI0030A2C6DF